MSNTHPRNPKFRITMLSLRIKGKSYAVCAHLPVGRNGKIKVPEDFVSSTLRQLGFPPNTIVALV